MGLPASETIEANEYESDDAWQVMHGDSCKAPNGGWVTAPSGTCSNTEFNDNRLACLEADGSHTWTGKTLLSETISDLTGTASLIGIVRCK